MSDTHQTDDHERRITELEIRVAWLEDTADSLNRQLAELHKQNQLQQQQLQLLYRKLSEAFDGEPTTGGNEPPPHY